MNDIPIPLYRLARQSSGRSYLAASAVDGFFVGEDSERAGDVVFAGLTHEPSADEGVLLDAEPRVVGIRGQSIGSYYIGDVELTAPPHLDESSGTRCCAVTFDGYTVPFAAAGQVWRRWASGSPIRRGEWMEYPAEVHRSWLHVVQNAWSETERDSRWYGHEEPCVLDGRRIVGEASFFCEVGESLNGPGGYFGSNLDALDDSLVTSGHRKPRQLVWQDSAFSRARLDGAFVAGALEILREHEVSIELA